MPRPKTKALEQAREALEAARETFCQALEEFASTLELRGIFPARARWNDAIEAFNAAAAEVQTAAQAYFNEHSERWQDSDKGQAFSTWIAAVGELAEFDGELLDQVRLVVDLSRESVGTALESDPDYLLPEIPEVPELEE